MKRWRLSCIVGDVGSRFWKEGIPGVEKQKALSGFLEVKAPGKDSGELSVTELHWKEKERLRFVHI